MDVKFCSRMFAIACSFALLSNALAAQTTTQVFYPIDGAVSIGGTQPASFSAPYTLSSITLNLSCSASVSPTIATLSGPMASEPAGYSAPATPVTGPPGGGNLIVDNNIFVAVTPSPTATGSPTWLGSQVTAGTPTNVCPVSGYQNGGEGIYTYDCFNGTYVNYTSSGGSAAASPLNGQDPDTALVPTSYTGTASAETLDAAGGVGPIDISPLLYSGTQSVAIAVEDEGYTYLGSTIYLTTNCTINGTSGGTVSGTPITTGTGGTGLTQTQNYNGGGTGAISLTFDISTANSQNTIVPNSNDTPVPQGTDTPILPSAFPSPYATGTSFGTSSCLIHSDELMNGSPVCKLYTLECLNLQTGVVAGYECPVSTAKNEKVVDFFDGPSFSLQNIYTPFGMFHEGMGLLMASDGWTGGPCTFDPLSGLQATPCPQNLLVSFTGPGGFGGSGDMNNANSTFISNSQVPEPNTLVYVAGQWPDGWVNTNQLQVYFLTQPPDLASGAYVLNSSNKLVPLPNTANYIPAPIQGITYGISPAGIPPATSGIQPANEPIYGDVTVLNKPSATSPAYSQVCEPNGPTGTYGTGAGDFLFTATYEPPFIPAVQTINSLPEPGTNPPSSESPIPDGQYLLHYYGQDCAGTQELNFTYSANPVGNPTGWSTNFFTYPVDIDTQKPSISAITLSPTNSPGYPAGTFTVGTAVTAKYSCTDPNAPVNGLNTGSGVVLCGTGIYLPQTEYSVAAQTPLPTGAASSKPISVTLYAVDGAGNISAPSTITYSVVKK